ncbi:hypothetical protein OAN58_02675 [Paracoccaceae bacterium]|nr:hypothetical protein [Paracoccaceae bacterium]
MPKHIVITGADSELGMQVVNLLSDLGHHVDAVALKNVDALEAANRIILHDMVTDPLPNDLIFEHSIVVHLASVKSNINGNVATAESLNARYARTLAASAPKRVIVRSSISVSICEHNMQRATAYGLEKQKAERILSEALPNSKLVILRPPAIYGSGISGPLNVLFDLVKKGVPLPLGQANAKRPYLSFINFASLLAHIVQLNDKNWSILASKPIEVFDGQLISTADLIREFAKLNNRNATLFPVPLFTLRALGALIGKRDLISGAIDPLPIEIDMERLASIGWQPPQQFPESLNAL